MLKNDACISFMPMLHARTFRAALSFFRVGKTLIKQYTTTIFSSYGSFSQGPFVKKMVRCGKSENLKAHCTGIKLLNQNLFFFFKLCVVLSFLTHTQTVIARVRNVIDASRHVDDMHLFYSAQNTSLSIALVQRTTTCPSSCCWDDVNSVKFKTCWALLPWP